MPEPLIFVFILLAVVAGFLLGRFTRRGSLLSKSRRGKSADLRQSYFEGLNYLLNEQPDAAIDTFVAALEVNSETLETHFALGNLLRRRGEVDRAIRIHQNLLARPSLSLRQQQQAQLELALDYMKSGLLDRAEALFKELVESDDLSVRRVCLERLVDIYRDEKEWQNAIDAAEQLCQRKLGSDVSLWRGIQAHFSCELAEQSIAAGDWNTARSWVDKALNYDKSSLRARLMLARIEMAQGQYDLAIKALRKIPSDSTLYVSEALPLLCECYERLGRTDVLYMLLTERYQAEPSELLLRRLAKLSFKLHGEAAARAFLAEELPAYPNLAPISDLLQIVEEQTGQQLEYPSFAPVLEKVLEAKGGYECGQCGFVGRHLHWCCPTCKNWGTMFARLGGTEPRPQPTPAIGA